MEPDSELSNKCARKIMQFLDDLLVPDVDAFVALLTCAELYFNKFNDEKKHPPLVPGMTFSAFLRDYAAGLDLECEKNERS